MTSSTLILVRHGKASDVEGRCIGHTDVPLSAEGRESFRRLTDVWLEQGAPLPARIISSDLTRARESAEILADSFGLAIDTDARLREMDFGAWDGRTWSDIETTDGVALNEWMAAWTTVRVPGGESFDELLLRAELWQRDFREHARASPVVVVSHAGWIRALLTQALGLERSAFFELPVDHAHLTVLRYDADSVVCVAKNVALPPSA